MTDPQYLTLEVGISSGGDSYWIRDIGDNKSVATGVPREYALLIMAAVNEQFGDPALLDPETP